MNETTWTLLGALTLTGLAGSLHCIGMCGPVLVGLSRGLPRGRSLAWDTVAYHLGRLWTYALLGLAAGAFGQRLAQIGNGRRLFAAALGVAVIVNGALMLRRGGTRFERWLSERWSALLRGLAGSTGLTGRRGFVARGLVGAVMGLTPCGMVWMALVPAAALGHPLLSAVGMLAFGLGTLPVLSSVVLLDRLLANRLRRHGRTIAAVALIIAGIVLFARAWPEEGEGHMHHATTNPATHEHPH